MKATSFFFAVTCLFFFANSTPMQGQNIAFWKGGTPGMEARWDCPKNWSIGRVPDAFQNVIIPDVSTGSGVYPVIEVGGQEVNALVLESGAVLEIGKDGSLLVNLLFEQFGSAGLEVDGAFFEPANVYAGGEKLEAVAKVGRN